jgi:hypothetical protein
MSKPDHSWREFYDVHPAAEFFHAFSSDEQLQELADDIDEQKVIFNPIHTASVPGHAKPFVIDGISRLDAAEATGRQIINEKGEWTGMLAATGSINRYVVHHPGKPDKDVWKIAVSLNNMRRHYTAGQLAAMADELATAKRGGDRRSDQSANLHNDREIEFDRPMTVSDAAKTVGVSKRSVQSFRKVKKEAPKTAEDVRKGKLPLGKAAKELPAKSKRQPKPPRKSRRPEKTLSERCWQDYSKAKLRFLPAERRRKVPEYLCAFLQLEGDDGLIQRVWNSYRWLMRKHSAAEEKRLLLGFAQKDVES